MRQPDEAGSCSAKRSFYNRQNRDRINDAFQLDDRTLEFVGIVPTLASPNEQPVEVWLVVFGVLMSIVVLMGVYLIISGIKDRKRKSAEPAVENPYNLEGRTNNAYEDMDNEQTGL